MSPTVEIFGLRLWKEGFDEAMKALGSAALKRGDTPRIVVTPNVDHLVRLHKNRGLFERYKESDFIFPDGFPVVVSSRLLGKSVKGRVTGADLFPAVCSFLASRGGKVFILGGRPGTEAQIESKLAAKYPGLEIKAYSPPFGFSAESREGQLAARMVNEMEPNAVFVCLGMPRQEQWAFNYRKGLKAGLILCVGAALEFDLGLVKRAPRVAQAAGMEWLWRLFSNPGRLWKRYLVDDVAFLGLLYREIRQGRGRQKRS